MPDDIGISISYPLPGTKFYEKVKDDLKLKANWTDSDDLSMLFKGSFNSKYYKKLHRYTHKEYRKSQAWQYFKTFIKNPFKVSRMGLRTILLSGYYIVFAFIFKTQLKYMQSTNA